MSIAYSAPNVVENLVEGGTPAWGIAHFFPLQGSWTEDDYLAIDAKRSLELKDGKLEVLPMPVWPHELIVKFLYHALYDFAEKQSLGRVYFAGMKWSPRKGLIRMPDVMFVREENVHRHDINYCQRFDLALEVVSPDAESYKRDYFDKRRDYAEHGISEYWIVDPQERRILVLSLNDGEYDAHGEFAPGEQATSRLLDRFAVDVTAVFAAADFQK